MHLEKKKKKKKPDDASEIEDRQLSSLSVSYVVERSARYSCIFALFFSTSPSSACYFLMVICQRNPLIRHKSLTEFYQAGPGVSDYAELTFSSTACCDVMKRWSAEQFHYITTCWVYLNRTTDYIKGYDDSSLATFYQIC